LHPDALSEILDLETTHFKDSFSPPPPLPATKVDSHGSQAFQPSYPFVPSSTVNSLADALPYHYLELSSMLLESAADDLIEPDTIRRLLRDLREVRMAKLRKGVGVLSGEGEGVRLDGVGAMEVGEQGSFIRGVVDNLRKLGGSREQTRRDERASQREGGGRDQDYEDDDDDMG
jgi:GINS complex subunit 2